MLETGTYSTSNLQRNFTSLFWVPFIVNESITVAFVIRKARKSHGLPVFNHSKESTLFDVLIQHSLLYYISCVSSPRLIPVY